MAASTPYRRTGCIVISATRSGRAHESSIEMPARTLRYSGSERPAWRMNQTGGRSTGSRRHARRNLVSDSADGCGAGVLGLAAVVTASMLARAGGPPAASPDPAQGHQRDAG